MSIEIFSNHVLINGQKIERPARIAPSQWLRYWENAEQVLTAKRDVKI